MVVAMAAPATPPTDVVGRCVGDFGKWQLRTILIIFLCKIPTSWFMAVVIFTAPTPIPGEYWCRPNHNFEPASAADWIRAAHPMVKEAYGERYHRDICHVYADVMEQPERYEDYLAVNRSDGGRQNRTIVPCTNFVFRSDFHSLIAEFNLICSRSLLLHLSQCFHIFGLLLGGIVAYLMLKKFSPRKVMLTGMLTQMVCGNSAGLVDMYELHVLFRCLSAMTCALMYTSGQMILVDITGGKSKVITTIVFELFWSIGLILLPSLSIFFNTWSQLYMAISMPTMVLVFLYRVIPDSPRWFLRNGFVEEAKTIVLEGARVNKITVPEDLDALLQAQANAISEEPPQARWTELWDGNPKRRHLLCVHYAWAIYILLFNSMVLNIRAYGHEYIHMNTVIMGFSEMFGVFIGMYLILYTKRRWLWTGLFSITSGVVAYLTWLIPNNLKLYHIVALEMIPSIAIKIATSSSMSILTTCTADLVDTQRKKTLMFSASVWARAWFLWVPFIGTAKVYGPTAPLTIFATMAVVGGILMSVINHSHRRAPRQSTAGKRQSVQLTTLSEALGSTKDAAADTKHVSFIETDVQGSIRCHDKV